MKKLLDIKHHVCDGCCMWSGIEDIYTMRTGEEVSESFLFALSSYGESVYLKFKRGPKPYMLSTADGRTQKTYAHISKELGLDYKIITGKPYETALKAVKKEIDEGRPVILGPVDMYHLPYLKMYHFVHIPIHYIMMVGYDEEAGCVYIYDCGREAMQTLPLDELKKAWDIEKGVCGGCNGYVKFTLPENPVPPLELAKAALTRKAKEQLEEKPYFVGVSAYEKLAKEFPGWRKNRSVDEYKKALAGLTEGFGTVPQLPNRIIGEPEDKEGFKFRGCYDRLGMVVGTLGTQHGIPAWVETGKLFEECGFLAEQITNKIVDYYCDDIDTMDELPALFLKIGELLRKAYEIMLK